MEERLMTDLMKILFLGLVQGIAEFMPISSSGHLVLVEHLMGIKSSGAVLESALHGGTLVSVLIFYRVRIQQLILGALRFERDSVVYCSSVVIGSIPAILVYAVFKHRIENAFGSPVATAFLLCITGIVLLSLFFVERRGVSEPGGKEITLFRAFLIGAAQAVALLPGISRSASTIVSGRHLGLNAEKAAEFSFLLAIPALAGAVLFKGLEAHHNGLGGIDAKHLLCGVAVAGVTGYFAIKYLIRILSAGKAWLFGIYCLAVGGVSALLMLGSW
jgi:undecaprenyl-diphosphatase